LTMPKVEADPAAFGKYFGEEQIFPDEALRDPEVPRPKYRGATPNASR